MMHSSAAVASNEIQKAVVAKRVLIPRVFGFIRIEPEISLVGVGLLVDLQVWVVERLQFFIWFGVVPEFVRLVVRTLLVGRIRKAVRPLVGWPSG
jgi:hypothetical protein